MEWELVYLEAAIEDLEALDGSVRKQVIKAIEKVRTNPLPKDEGGYGAPLGNKRGFDLTGLLKVKLRGPGIRIVYKLERAEDCMKIIVIGAREDFEVYKEAAKRV